MTIRVEDPNPNHYDECYLNVTLTDVNDNVPEFQPQYYTIHLNENISVGYISTFTVTDADSGKNGDIE